MTEMKREKNNRAAEKTGHRRYSMLVPLLLIVLFTVVMVVYTSRLMYNVAISNSSVVIEDI